MNDDTEETFRMVAFNIEEAHQAVTRGYAHAKALIANGVNVAVSVGPALESISTKQRKFLRDIVFGQIAEQVFLGEKRERYSKQVWAEFFRERLLGSRFEMRKMPGAKRATPRRVRNSTEELGVRRYAEYTDEVIQIATAEYGVAFVFKTGEREATRPARRQRPQETADHDDRSAAG